MPHCSPPHLITLSPFHTRQATRGTCRLSFYSAPERLFSFACAPCKDAILRDSVLNLCCIPLFPSTHTAPLAVSPLPRPTPISPAPFIDTSNSLIPQLLLLPPSFPFWHACLCVHPSGRPRCGVMAFALTPPRAPPPSFRTHPPSPSAMHAVCDVLCA